VSPARRFERAFVGCDMIGFAKGSVGEGLGKAVVLVWRMAVSYPRWIGGSKLWLFQFCPDFPFKAGFVFFFRRGSER
jgi:hypothetical protein